MGRLLLQLAAAGLLLLLTHLPSATCTVTRTLGTMASIDFGFDFKKGLVSLDTQPTTFTQGCGTSQCTDRLYEFFIEGSMQSEFPPFAPVNVTLNADYGDKFGAACPPDTYATGLVGVNYKNGDRLYNLTCRGAKGIAVNRKSCNTVSWDYQERGMKPSRTPDSTSTTVIVGMNSTGLRYGHRQLSATLCHWQCDGDKGFYTDIKNDRCSLAKCTSFSFTNGVLEGRCQGDIPWGDVCRVEGCNGGYQLTNGPQNYTCTWANSQRTQLVWISRESTQCQDCPPGFSCPSGALRPLSCVLGQTYSPGNAGTCTPVTQYCAQGQYQSQTATSSSDTVCTQCPSGKYQPATQHNQTQCLNASPCTAGKYVKVSATTTSNTVCDTCADGTVQPSNSNWGGLSSCQQPTVCYPGQFVISGPSLTADRNCGYCDGTNSFSTNLNAESCSLVGKCRPGQYARVQPTTSSDRVCDNCPSKTFQSQDNYIGKFCISWRTCLAGTYQAAEPTATSNRVCLPCPAGYTTESNTNSPNCTACSAGTYNPTAGTAFCAQCTLGQSYQDGTAATSCKSVTAACETNEGEIPPTLSSDRTCFTAATTSRYIMTASDIGHYSIPAPASRFFTYDYLASAGGLIGGASLPDRITLSQQDTLVLLEIRPPDTYKLRMALRENARMVLTVDLQYCEDGGTMSSNVSTTLRAAQVNGNTVNAGLSWRWLSANFSTDYSCFRINAESKMVANTTAWQADRLLLIMSIPSQAASGTRVFRGLRTNAIKALYAPLWNAAGQEPLLGFAADPGPMLFVRDTEPPVFSACPQQSLTAVVPASSTTTLFSWTQPAVSDNSGIYPTISLKLAAYDRSLSETAVTTVNGQSSAYLYVGDAPYTVQYTAIDGSDNQAQCQFAIGVVYNASSSETLDKLEEQDLQGSWSAGIDTAVFGQTLVNGSHADGSQVLQQLSIDVSQQRLITVSLATDVGDDGGGFRLEPETSTAALAVLVDMTWALAGSSLPSEASLVDSDAFAYLLLEYRGEQVDRRRRSEGGSGSGENATTTVRIRLITDRLVIGSSLIAVRGNALLPMQDYEHLVQISLQVGYYDGRSGSSSQTLLLSPHSSLRIVQVQPGLRTGIPDDQMADRLTFFSFADNQPPSFTLCPSNIERNTDSGRADAAISWSEPAASDNVGQPRIVQLLGPASGTRVSITYDTVVEVQFQAFDGAGHTALCAFNLTVVDNEPPRATCPASQVSYDVTSSANTIRLPSQVMRPSAFSDNSGLAVILTTPGTPTLGVGKHSLYSTLTDASGKLTRCYVSVTVRDPYPPTFTVCEQPAAVSSVNDEAQVFWRTPMATDNDQVVLINSTASPGSMFPQGRTEVIYMAVDASGNVARCTIAVEVQQPAAASGSERAGGVGASQIGPIGGGLAALLLVIIVAMLLWRRAAKRKLPADFAAIITSLHLDEYSTASDHRARKPRELPRESVIIVEVIGKGNFGVVAKAQYAERRGRVIMPAYLTAVKQLHSAASSQARQEILSEAAIMAQFEHDNVLRLIGVVTAGDPILVVMEYMEHGSLQAYLKSHAGKLSESRQLKFGLDLAEGLAYLHEHRFIHRDVATRNVLLSSTLTAKLADFGLTRETMLEATGDYYRSQGGAVPVRWTAPEALEERKFSAASDVFSYGITLYEIFTDGAMPYKGWSNQMVWVEVSAGYRLSCPPDCREEVHQQIMLTSWAADASARPTMKSIVKLLENFLQDAKDTAPPGSRADEASRRATQVSMHGYELGHSDGYAYAEPESKKEKGPAETQPAMYAGQYEIPVSATDASAAAASEKRNSTAYEMPLTMMDSATDDVEAAVTAEDYLDMDYMETEDLGETTSAANDA